MKITLNYEETIVNQFVTVSDTIPEKDDNSNRIFDNTFDGTFG